jgi:drug/metabolite transporter (DMT)-like permease
MSGTAEGRRLAGIGLMCGAVACFALLDCSAKWLGTRGLDPLTIAWARYAVAMLLVSAFINPVTTPGALRTNRFRLQALRSLLLLGSTAFNFVALRYLQLAETVSIQFATPLLVALLAGPMLGEWIGARRLVAIGVGFVGVLAVVRPGPEGVQPAALFCLGNVVCYAFYILTTRRLAGIDSTATTTFYSGVAGVALLTPALPLVWTSPTSGPAWALLAALGLFGGFGHWLFVLAHARAPAAVLAPFIYTQLLWMLILGWVVFGDVPGPWTLAGAGIVVASGLYLLDHERVRGVEPKAAPRA